MRDQELPLDVFNEFIDGFGLYILKQPDEVMQKMKRTPYRFIQLMVK